MPIGRQDATIALSIVVSSKLKRVVRTHNAKYVWIHFVAIVFPLASAMILIVIQSWTTLLGVLVMLFFRQSYVFPILTMHDVKHAFSLIVSHEKVFGVMSTATNRESIYRPTIG
jgi:hypothetical protein